MYGAAEEPMICEYALFSIITTTTWVYVALDFVPHGLFELGAALPEVVAATITAAAIAGRLKGVVTETSSSSARPTGRDVAYLFGVYHSGRSSKLHATSG